MSTNTTLASAIADMVKNNTLPEFEFTDARSLRTVAQNLSVAEDAPIDVPADMAGILSVVNQFDAVIKDPFNKGMLQAFTGISSAFADRIKDAFQNLHDIKEEVTQMTQKVTNRAKSVITADPVLASTEQDLTALRLKSIRWDLIDHISIPAALGRLNTKYNISPSSIKNPQYQVEDLLANLPMTTVKNTVELGKITLPKRKVRDIFNAVHAKLNNKLDRKTVSHSIATILSMDSFDIQRSLSSIRGFYAGENVADVNHLLQMVNVYSQILPKMTPEILDVAKSTQAEIDKRVEILRDYIDTAAVVCNYYRCTNWKDAIVTPGMLINTDNWRNFCASEKRPIKVNPHLAIIQYVNRLYKDQALPVNGIKGEYIDAACENIAKECQDEASANAGRVNSRKKEIFRDAFIDVAFDWLKRNGGYTDSYLYGGQPARYVATIYDTNPDDAVENMFYTVMMNSQKYNNTLIAAIQKGLRDEYKKATLSAERLTTRDLTNVDVRVLADTIAEFLVDLVVI